MITKRSIFGSWLLTLFLSTFGLADDTSIKTRPEDQTPTQIQTAVFVIDIREIDGSKQLYAGDIAVRLRWKDPRLASAEKARVLPVAAVWNPNIQLVNRILVQTTLPETLEVDGEGNVLYRQRYIGQFSCKMDLKEFPFDRQSIPVWITSPGNTPSEVRFVQDPESAIMDSLSVTDWRILSWRSRQDPLQIVPGAKALASYRFEFIVERRFYFFLVQIVIPMILIVGMSWIVFWLDPGQPGPRISISITSMLTVVAYRLLLGNFLPRLSFLTRLDYFVFGCTFLVFLSLVCIVTISRLLIQEKKSLALMVDRHARWIFPTLFILVLVNCFWL